jgi:vacuolar-type H+-ATPase subunit D/Vma8
MESESMIKALEESREELKGSIVDFSEEQEKYKEELVKASEGKYSTTRRKGMQETIENSEYFNFFK